MRVLVTTASKHGATDEIGRRIAATLDRAGLTVVSAAPEAVVSVDGYDAVILGSGVYAGRWVESAKAFVEREREALRRSASGSSPAGRSAIHPSRSRSRPMSPR